MQKKILVVDDEPLVLRVVAITLEREGFSVVAAANGKEALKLCVELSDAIALVLTDLEMPEMTGRELADCISGLPKPIPVIFMSGYAEPSPWVRGLKDGRLAGFRFIGKPFRHNELVTEVSVALMEIESGQISN